MIGKVVRGTKEGRGLTYVLRPSLPEAMAGEATADREGHSHQLADYGCKPIHRCLAPLQIKELKTLIADKPNNPEPGT